MSIVRHRFAIAFNFGRAFACDAITSIVLPLGQGEGTMMQPSISNGIAPFSARPLRGGQLAPSAGPLVAARQPHDPSLHTICRGRLPIAKGQMRYLRSHARRFVKDHWGRTRQPRPSRTARTRTPVAQGCFADRSIPGDSRPASELSVLPYPKPAIKAAGHAEGPAGPRASSGLGFLTGALPTRICAPASDATRGCPARASRPVATMDAPGNGHGPRRMCRVLNVTGRTQRSACSSTLGPRLESTSIGPLVAPLTGTSPPPSLEQVRNESTRVLCNPVNGYAPRTVNT